MARKAAVAGGVFTAIVVFLATLTAVVGPGAEHGHPAGGGYFGALSKKDSDDDKDSDSSDSKGSDDEDSDSGDSDSKDSDSKDSDSKDSDSGDSDSKDSDSDSGDSDSKDSDSGDDKDKKDKKDDKGSGESSSSSGTSSDSDNSPGAGPSGRNTPGGSTNTGGPTTESGGAPANTESDPTTPKAPAGGTPAQPANPGNGVIAQINCTKQVSDEAGLKDALATAGPNDVICVRGNLGRPEPPAPTARVLPPGGSNSTPSTEQAKPKATEEPTSRPESGGRVLPEVNKSDGASAGSGESPNRGGSSSTPSPSRKPSGDSGSGDKDSDKHSDSKDGDSKDGDSEKSGDEKDTSEKSSNEKASNETTGTGGTGTGGTGGSPGGAGSPGGTGAVKGLPADAPGGPPGASTPKQVNCTKQVTGAELNQAVNSAAAGDRLCVTGQASSARLEIKKGGTADKPVYVIGNGKTAVKGLTVEADNVVVDGFTMEGPKAPGIEIKGKNITVQNNTVSHPTGGDYDGIRFFGDNLRILHNTITNITNTGGAHADCMQTFTSGGGPPTSNLIVDGNKCDKIDNQCIMAEGPGDVGDGGGGPGKSENWTISNNFCQFGASQGLMIEAIQNITINNNEFQGNADKAIGLDINSTGAKVKANILGSGIKAAVGMSENSKEGYEGPKPQGGP